MDADTLEALRGSIAKWQRIVGGTGRDEGYENCPLCVAFPNAKCTGCPVARAVNASGCRDTPYDEWAQLETATANTPEEKAAAQAELDFLKSLLPPGVES